MTRISYQPSEFAFNEFTQCVMDLAIKMGSKAVCEIGGGANPALSSDFIREHGLDYAIIDVSKAELDKAPSPYNKIHADIVSEDLRIQEKYDLIFSRMLAEHVKNGRLFHENVYRLLTEKGIAFHFFPTLYSLPFIANRILPENISINVLDLLVPSAESERGKFPAYYKWCLGPTKKQIRRFEAIGYRVVEYRGFFGHKDYYKSIKPLKWLHTIKTSILLRHPNPFFTSYAYVILSKNQEIEEKFLSVLNH